MATLNVIRRWALREQMSIREISRRTGLARNTVKKYLRSDEVEPKHAGQTRSSKLDPYAEKLALWLGMEVTKSRKQRRNLKQIHTVIFLKPEMTAIGSRIALQRLNLKRRRSRTYPQPEHLVLKKRVGQELMERLGQASAQFNSNTPDCTIRRQCVVVNVKQQFREIGERTDQRLTISTYNLARSLPRLFLRVVN